MAGHALPAGHRVPGSRAAGGGAASLSTPATGTLADAGAALAAGSLVVFPTETVYGLGADARSSSAVARLVAVRGREAGKPILVLVADLEMAASVSVEPSREVRRLAERFWPGALTLVLPARDGLPAPLTAGTATIGVRVPAHPTARALVAGLGAPVTAPSANPPGADPPRTLAAARAYFGNAVAVYVDGGVLPGGASTVASVGGGTLRVLRAGPVPESALRAVLQDEPWRS
jgi:L-threonylcarbamoyladenylate synthase